MTVNSSGAVKLAGALADATRLRQAARLSAEGYWPFYLPLYGGKGQILGWLDFTDLSPQSELSGWLSWIKPSNASPRFYPNGFSIIVTNVISSPTIHWPARSRVSPTVT